jgi:HK97 gp10 family phage protein
MSSVRFDFDESALFAKLDKLKAKLQDAARPAAQAAAQVFYDEVKLRAPLGTRTHGYKGKPNIYPPGNLKASIYQVYSKDRSVNGKQTYQISFNRQKAFYGWFVEFGRVNMPAQSFIRSSYTAQKNAALEASKAKFLELAQKAINGP